MTLDIILLYFIFSDDLRTANIVCDSPDGTTCLVIDRETFNQLISALDEIRTKYKDEGDSRARWDFLKYYLTRTFFFSLSSLSNEMIKSKWMKSASIFCQNDFQKLNSNNINIIGDI